MAPCPERSYLNSTSFGAIHYPNNALSSALHLHKVFRHLHNHTKAKCCRTVRFSRNRHQESSAREYFIYIGPTLGAQAKQIKYLQTQIPSNREPRRKIFMRLLSDLVARGQIKLRVIRRLTLALNLCFCFDAKGKRRFRMRACQKFD